MRYLDVSMVERKIKDAKSYIKFIRAVGKICVFMTIISILSLLLMFKYDKETSGKITSKEFIGDKYYISIEYYIDDRREVKYELVDSIPYNVEKTNEIKVRYNSKTKAVFMPELEIESIILFISTSIGSALIAYVCFQKAKFKEMILEKIGETI